ncbi:hypothetical protein Dimus_002872 [Dionaea muscipula]
MKDAAREGPWTLGRRTQHVALHLMDELLDAWAITASASFDACLDELVMGGRRWAEVGSSDDVMLFLDDDDRCDKGEGECGSVFLVSWRCVRCSSLVIDAGRGGWRCPPHSVVIDDDGKGGWWWMSTMVDGGGDGSWCPSVVGDASARTSSALPR